MGKIFTLSGPSGIGKTTFLNLVEDKMIEKKLKLIPRYTSRPKRDGEEEGFEYFFVSHSGLLAKVFENDFIHFEKWGDYYSAIDKKSIDETIESDEDGIILASTYGTNRLQATYLDKVIPVYMWSGEYKSLQSKKCLSPSCYEIIELKRRIRKKLIEDGFSEFETASLANEVFLEKRMIDNYIDIAAVYGKLKSGDKFYILENYRDKQKEMIKSFFDFFEKNRKN